MKSTDLLLDAFGRILDEVAETVSGLGDEQLTFRPDPGANSIAWLVWHLTRVQDNHVAEAAQEPEVWPADGWVDRFGLSLDPADTGYGHRAEDVAAVRAPATCWSATTARSPNGPVATSPGWATPTSTASSTSGGTRRSPSASRLVSVIGDDMAHLGQAQYVKGLLERAGALTAHGPAADRAAAGRPPRGG